MAPVSSSRTVILAPGITAPDGSVTTPLMAPMLCPHARVEKNRMIGATRRMVLPPEANPWAGWKYMRTGAGIARAFINKGATGQEACRTWDRRPRLSLLDRG